MSYIPKGATHVNLVNGYYYLEREDGNFLRWNAWHKTWEPSPAANRGEIDLVPVSRATTPADLPVTPEEDAAWEEGERRMRNIASNGNDGLAYDAPLLSDEECEALKANTKDDVRSKYHVEIKQGVWIDVYDVLSAFNVTNPALQHLIKKALKPGDRGHKDKVTDLRDIVQSAQRALELEQ